MHRREGRRNIGVAESEEQARFGHRLDVEAQRPGDERIGETRHHHPAAGAAVEDLCAQRVDVRRKPPFPAAAFGDMDDLRQPGQRRMVEPGDHEGAAHDDGLRPAATTANFGPPARRHREGNAGLRRPTHRTHRVQHVSVAAGEQDEVAGPQPARLPSLDGHLALALDDDMHAAQPGLGEGDPERFTEAQRAVLGALEPELLQHRTQHVHTFTVRRVDDG